MGHEPDYSLNKPGGDGSEDENFAKDSTDASSVDESGNHSEEIMVVVPAIKDKTS